MQGPGSRQGPFTSDQADGLRRQFATRAARFVPVVSNPELAFGGVLLERLCSALASLKQHVLVVDASERSGEPKELAAFDLGEGIESLSSQVSYLAARGLAVRHVDSHGSTHAFLDNVVQAAPFAQVVLVHAQAGELARLFSHSSQMALGGHALWQVAPRPLLLCDDRREGLTHAYTALKLLSQRGQWRAYDLLVSAALTSPRASQVADRLAQCADQFLSCVQRRWIAVDPAEPATAPPSRALTELVAELLAASNPVALAQSWRNGSQGLASALPGVAAD